MRSRLFSAILFPVEEAAEFLRAIQESGPIRETSWTPADSRAVVALVSADGYCPVAVVSPANTVPDGTGLYFVAAFPGLAPGAKSMPPSGLSAWPMIAVGVSPNRSRGQIPDDPPCLAAPGLNVKSDPDTVCGLDGALRQLPPLSTRLYGSCRSRP